MIRFTFNVGLFMGGYIIGHHYGVEDERARQLALIRRALRFVW